ncbi:hypothetical protein Drorol1_Dr00026003 [Drosera rotundifolia]
MRRLGVKKEICFDSKKTLKVLSVKHCSCECSSRHDNTPRLLQNSWKCITLITEQYSKVATISRKITILITAHITLLNESVQLLYNLNTSSRARKQDNHPHVHPSSGDAAFYQLKTAKEGNEPESYTTLERISLSQCCQPTIQYTPLHFIYRTSI